MLGAILAAGFGSLLMSNPRRKKRRRNPQAGKAELLAEYNKLPVTATPEEFMEGHGNWGLTEAEYRKAVRLAEKITGKRRRNPKTAHPVGRCDACGQTMSRTHHLKKGGYNAAREIDREADRDHKPFSRELGSRRRNPSAEATELVLFITNDGDLYRQQAQPIIKNLRKKIAKGTYDAAKAVKLWGYLANSGAQKYTKEFGGSGNGSYGSFSAADRRAAAKELADSYEEELRSTNPRRSRKWRKGGTKMPSLLREWKKRWAHGRRTSPSGYRESSARSRRRSR